MGELEEKFTRLEERFDHANSVRRRDWWWIGAIVLVALTALGITGWVEAQSAVATKFATLVKDDLEDRIQEASKLADALRKQSIHVPVRTVVAFAGTGDPPLGWACCDGTSIDTVQEGGKFKALIAVIERTWGNGGDPKSWEGPETSNRPRKANLPDLRGMFLRGAHGDKRNDKYCDPGGREGSGFDAGSFQRSATGPHEHFMRYKIHVARGDKDKDVSAFCVGTLKDGLDLIDRGHFGDATHPDPDPHYSETRPNNAAVNWIIKY